jgi:response regulator RpfG family c-di-GMP phosphodiesterase
MKNILIVDDEIDLREIIEFSVESEFENPIVTAKSGNEAIEVLKTNANIGVIICDYSMPNGNGATVFDYNHDAAKVPFILLSGQELEDCKDIRGFYESNPNNAVVRKPWKDDALIDAINNALATEPFAINDVATESVYRKIRCKVMKRCFLDSVSYYARQSDESYDCVLEKGQSVSDSSLQNICSDYEYLYLTNEDFQQYLNFYTKVASQKMATVKELQETFQLTADVVEVYHLCAQELALDETQLATINTCVHGCMEKINSIDELKSHLEDIISGQDYLIAHSLLSMQFSYIIAKNMGQAGKKTLERLGFASLLQHLTLPSSKHAQVLDRDDPILEGMESSQKNMVLNHPKDSATLVGSSEDFEQVSLIIMDHHERPDGKGFPYGKTAEKIDTISAIFILSVRAADCVYRNSKDTKKLDECLNYLKSTFATGNFEHPLKALEKTLK